MIRDRNNQLKGFHNVCRHRAGPIVTSQKGQCNVLRCGYHGWVYDSDGKLKKTPEFGCDVNKQDFSLFPVRVETWKGLVFINVDMNATSLSSCFSELDDVVGKYDIDNWQIDREVIEPIQCNWKAYVDNYMEGYHIGEVHPALTKLIDTKQYRAFISKKQKYVIQTAPAKNGSYSSGDWIWIFPNVALNFYPNGCSIERMIPTSATTMHLHYTFMFAPSVGEEERKSGFDGSMLLTEEDRLICQNVQKNLQSGLYVAGPLSPKHENGVFRFHEWIRQLRDK